MFKEGGPVEILQICAWVIAFILGTTLACRHPTRRNIALGIWLAFVALLCAFREIDAHTYLNPETLGQWGVRYRSDWWLSPDVSPFLKITWASIGLVILLTITVPLIVARIKPLMLLRAHDKVAFAFIAAAALLFIGYAADDLIGRGLIVSRSVSVPIEETAELIGVIFFATALALLVKRPHTVRQELARARLNANPQPTPT